MTLSPLVHERINGGQRSISSGRWILLLLVLVLAGRSAVSAEPGRRPNIVILLADDLGFADLSLHGSKEIKTPHIDSLAKHSIRCTNGYVSAPYCSPTRAGLLTGRYQQRFGHEFNPVLLKQGGTGQGLPLSETTLAQRAKSLGYVTALIGKWHLGEEAAFHPLSRGFDEFFGFLPGSHGYFESEDPDRGPIYRGKQKVDFTGYATDVFAKEAGAFFDRHREKPFLLYLAFNAVHTPMHAPDATIQKFAHIEDSTRRTYLAMTAKLDEAVGTVLAKLRELGLEENTLIFFLSDNGGPIGKFASNGSSNVPLRGSKGDTWEGGIRVPFLVQWKGKLPAGRTYNHPVISLDILPTVLAAAGAEVNPEWKLDGVDLLAFLSGTKTSPPHESLFWRFGRQMAIRQGDWMLVRPSMGKKEYVDVSPRPLLFDLSKDVGQQHDLAAQHPDRVAKMQAAWDRWSAELPAPRWPATLGGKVITLSD